MPWDGLTSRSGWSLIDDLSSRLVGEYGWPEPLSNEDDYRDLNFFGCGNDYRSWAMSIHRSRTGERCRDQLRAFRLESKTRGVVDAALDRIAANPKRLLPFVVNMAETRLRAFLETATQSGIESTDLPGRREELLLENNLENGNVVFSYSAENAAEWKPSHRFRAEQAIVPRSRIIDILS